MMHNPIGRAYTPFGAILIGAGGVIATIAGLGSLWFLGSVCISYDGSPDRNGIVMSGLPYAAVFGGIPFLIALGPLFAGYRLRRSRPPAARPGT